MKRQASLSYLSRKFKNLINESGFKPDEAEECFGLAVDNAWRELGEPEDVIAALAVNIDQGQIKDYLALLEYFALKQFTFDFSNRIDTAPDLLPTKRSQIWDHTKALLNDALADISARGYGPDSFSLGRLGLDIYEPGEGY